MVAKHSILLILLSVAVLNCKSQTIIKGSLSSFPSTSFQIIYNQNILNDFKGDQLTSGVTNERGDFISEIKLAEEDAMLLLIGKQFLKLWVVPGTTLLINEMNGKYTFQEPGKHNIFLYEAHLMTPQITNATNKFEPVLYTSYLDSLEQKRWMMWQTTFESQKLSDNFNAYCKGEITYATYLNKYQYPLRYLYMDKTITQKDIPQSYNTFWDSFSLIDDSCTNINYQNALKSYIEYLAIAKSGNAAENKEIMLKNWFLITDSLLTTRPLTKQIQSAEMLSFIINYFDFPQLVNEQLLKAEKEFPYSAYINLAKQLWDKKNKRVATSPHFTLKDKKGNLFDSSSLKGKVVYIDFWGSWCKPCLAEMPASALLQEKMQKKDVVFLFINFYDTEAQWLKIIQEKNLGGIHLKAEAKDHAYFERAFGINKTGFPRYALLDKNGVLVSTSAPRPSDQTIIHLIEQYLK